MQVGVAAHLVVREVQAGALLVEIAQTLHQRMVMAELIQVAEVEVVLLKVHRVRGARLVAPV
jgi:hypothetical protein